MLRNLCIAAMVTMNTVMGKCSVQVSVCKLCQYSFVEKVYNSKYCCGYWYYSILICMKIGVYISCSIYSEFIHQLHCATRISHDHVKLPSTTTQTKQSKSKHHFFSWWYVLYNYELYCICKYCVTVIQNCSTVHSCSS